MTKGSTTTYIAVMALTTFLLALAITGTSLGRIPVLQEELRDETVDLTAKRIEVSAYALDALQDDVDLENVEDDSIKMELELPDDYTVSQEDLESQGNSVILAYRDNSHVIDPPMENSNFRMDPEINSENIQSSEFICLEKESDESSSTITISGGEC